jgi:hypothetical protein
MPSAITSHSGVQALPVLASPKPLSKLSDCNLGLLTGSAIVRDIILGSEWRELQWERAPHVQVVIGDSARRATMSLTELYKKAVAYLQGSCIYPVKADKAPFAPTLSHVQMIDEAIQAAEDDANLLLAWKKIVACLIYNSDKPLPRNLLKPVKKDLKEMKQFLFENAPLLDKIKFLNLSNLGLTSVPRELNYFKKLEKLDLSGNKIGTLNPQLGSFWVNLRHLDLSNNLLTSLPRNFGMFWTNLRFLSLSCNLLTHLPRKFGSAWTSLQSIFLQQNRLVFLPFQFLENSESLRFLCLGWNLLKGLKKGTDKLWPNMRFVSLQGNCIEKMHADFGDSWQWWSRLGMLSLKGNPVLKGAGLCRVL